MNETEEHEQIRRKNQNYFRENEIAIIEIKISLITTNSHLYGMTSFWSLTMAKVTGQMSPWGMCNLQVLWKIFRGGAALSGSTQDLTAPRF